MGFWVIEFCSSKQIEQIKKGEFITLSNFCNFVVSIIFGSGLIFGSDLLPKIITFVGVIIRIIFKMNNYYRL